MWLKTERPVKNIRTVLRYIFLSGFVELCKAFQGFGQRHSIYNFKGIVQTRFYANIFVCI